MPDEVKLAALRAEFDRLQELRGFDAQTRGQRLNGFVAELLACWGITARANERSIGEIDVAFAIGEVRYVLEAKWERRKADTGHLAKLQRRVRQRLTGTFGIFLSMSGYSPEALSEVSLGERLEVLLLDSEHLQALLAGSISPQQLLSIITDAAAFRGQAYTPMPEVFASSRADVGRSGVQTLRPSKPAKEGVLAPEQHPVRWDPVRPDRGNPKGQYVAFTGRQGAYALITVLLGLLAAVLVFILIDSGATGKIVSGALIALCVVLMIGFGNMARVPVRLEIGAEGIQVLGRRETTWLPWEVIDRVDVVRVAGNPYVVAWSRYADRFPDTDTMNGGSYYLPSLGAIAVCPMNVLRARRHDVVRALDRYAGNRI